MKFGLAIVLAFAASSLFAGACVFTADDAQLAYRTAAALVKDCTPRNAGTIRGRLAAEWIMDRASRTGVDASVDIFTAPVYSETAQFANVVVELPGTDPKAPWIVLISHFDTAPNVPAGFEGANDGAATSGLLVAMAGVLRRAGRARDNVMLAWTDAEECRISYSEKDGFQGSKHLVEDFRRKGRAVKAAICLDMLGDRDLRIDLPSNSTPALVKLVLQAAKIAGVADKVAVCDTVVVKDDHSAFIEAGCPAIDLIDLFYGSAPGKNDYWHTPKDTLDKISEASLLASGRLVAELLNLVVRR